jgi:DNA-binding NtrC family response regulator
MLSQHIVRSICQKHGRPTPELSIGLIERLCMYDWPGNIRELQNVLERMIILGEEQRLTLPKDFPAPQQRVSEPLDIPDGLTMDTVERLYIERTLKRTNWRIAGPSGAASILGMHHNPLRGRMKKLGMDDH